MELKRTPLYQECLKAGGRMVSFAGWEMPVQFSGLVQEHQAVRQKSGVFDISHMGVIQVTGNNSKDLLQTLVPTDLHRIGPGEACYTVLLNETGGILDDLIVYDLGVLKKQEESLLVVLNASCTASDLSWLKKHLEPAGISVTDAKREGVFLALQGPQARELIEKVSGESLKNLPRFGHRKIKLRDIGSEEMNSIFISRTGYTGEEGFELLLSAKLGKLLWEQLINAGVIPCGLGARDTLRLEAAMHLYGNEMNQTTTPFEAGLGWLVHLEMTSNFIGRDALEKQAKEGLNRRLIGLRLKGRAIARNGYPVFYQNQHIGEITSGTWSPTLGEAIALAYIPAQLSKIGHTLNVEIRGKKHPATVVKRPFYRRA